MVETTPLSRRLMVMAILEGLRTIQKAEICLKRNDALAGRGPARRRSTWSPKQADYIAMMAWLQLSQTAEAGSCLDRKNKCASSPARSASVRHASRPSSTVAILWKRLGDEANAIRDFQASRGAQPARPWTLSTRFASSTCGEGTPEHPPGSRSPNGKRKKEEGIFGRFFKK